MQGMAELSQLGQVGRDFLFDDIDQLAEPAPPVPRERFPVRGHHLLIHPPHPSHISMSGMSEHGLEAGALLLGQEFFARPKYPTDSVERV